AISLEPFDVLILKCCRCASGAIEHLPFSGALFISKALQRNTISSNSGRSGSFQDSVGWPHHHSNKCNYDAFHIQDSTELLKLGPFAGPPLQLRTRVAEPVNFKSQKPWVPEWTTFPKGLRVLSPPTLPTPSPASPVSFSRPLGFCAWL
ncbi:hypothetical protein U0070_013126, partial [Myodes glareolus]